ncbi:MAG: aminotransferase class V-fold PLP-dependent enzyme [Gammaproteobacteria bacterium]|jgi:selenocysteine lyase/cysteine desulfurase|nr:aminotransferase class V-fold PLP-dependent enzyme [Gammaproteobacteria bacterium]
MQETPLEFSFLRQQIVGIDSAIQTPFGKRLMAYCDYTASGRCLLFVEKYLQGLQRNYANTHTEDDLTGRSMTQLLHEAENMIKSAVNAGPNGRLVACGTGATGAINKFQQIVGVALAPATADTLRKELEGFLGEQGLQEFRAYQRSHQPVVFVGPYEHHSNEVSWRQGLASVVEVGLDEDGGIDLVHLEQLLHDPAYLGRPRIGSFSAASNVTGMKSRVHEIAILLHRHDALACFDFAASAPYVDIDMNPEPAADGEDPTLDAIFISPHKFLGGPGSSGILIFNDRLYHHELAPSVGGGGTVDYVSPTDQDFVKDVEEREKAGTPGVLQTLKAALAFQIKRNLGPERIEKRESELLQRAATRWQANPQIEILGNPDMTRRIGIVSFNLRDPGGLYLHPKLATVLLNDLFGIQSRAGCSCAGPYGHRLLGIDQDTSEQYRDWVRKGFHGIKPGWCRVGFHFVMDDAEADYVIEAVNFLADYGYRFLSLYDFDVNSGMWSHRNYEEQREEFTLGAALRSNGCDQTALPADVRARLYQSYLDDALTLAQSLGEPADADRERLKDRFGKLQFFCA